MVYVTRGLTLAAGIAGIAALVWGWNSRRQMAALGKAVLLLTVSAVVAFFAYNAWQRARLVEVCAQNLRYIGAAAEVYGDNYHAYPGSLDALMPFYFDDLPVCPLASGQESNGYELEYKANGDVFTVSCHGNLHEGLGGAPQGYPMYSSEQGLVLR